jgi:hypothetical protein
MARLALKAYSGGRVAKNEKREPPSGSSPLGFNTATPLKVAPGWAAAQASFVAMDFACRNCSR